MKKKLGTVFCLSAMVCFSLAGCGEKNQDGNVQAENAEKEEETTESKRADGVEYVGTGYRLYYDKKWTQKEEPGAELFLEYGESETEENVVLVSTFEYLDNYDGNPGKWYNAEMQSWKDSGFVILGSENIQNGPVTFYRTEIEAEDLSFVQYFVINHNIKYNFQLIPYEQDLYDECLAEFDEMIQGIQWEDVKVADVNPGDVKALEITEENLQQWKLVEGNGFAVKISDDWFEYVDESSLSAMRREVCDGYEENLFFVTNPVEFSLEEGYAHMQDMIENGNFEVIESGQEITVGGQKGYRLITRQTLKYIDIYRETYYTVRNGKEYAFTFQADGCDYEYLKNEKEAILNSIVMDN